MLDRGLQNEDWWRREKRGLLRGLLILAAGFPTACVFAYSLTRGWDDGIHEIAPMAGLVAFGCLIIGLNAVVRGLLAVARDFRTKDARE